MSVTFLDGRAPGFGYNVFGMPSSLDFPILAALITLGYISPTAAQTTPDVITLKAPDGIVLKASYFSPGRPGPALLLLPQCDYDRASWRAFAAAAAEEGFHVLTLDYRGYGESEGQRSEKREEQAAVMAAKWPGDIDTAFDWLAGRPGVDRSRLAAAGASCGATQAAYLAQRRRAVRTIVLLSGGAAPAVRDFLGVAGWLPVLGAASLDDGPVVPQMRALLAASAHPASRFVEFAAGGHGTDMLAAQKGLAPLILAWLETNLGPGAALRHPASRSARSR